MVPAELSVAKQRSLSWSARRTELVIVAAATALAGVLSLLFIGDKSLWIDEATSLYFAREGATLWHKLAHREANMWFYYLLLHLWLRLGDNEAVARALSAVCAVATVPVLYGLGRRLFGGRAGAIAALLLAWHPFLIRYAQEVRGYTLLVFTVTLSSYLFLRARQDGLRRDWAGHGLTMGLALQTHFFAGLAYLVQMLTLPWAGKTSPWRRGFLLSGAVVAVFVVPIVLFQPLASEQIEWVQPLTLRQLYRFCTLLAGSRPLLLLYVVACVLAVVSAAHRRSRGEAAHEWWPYLFVTAWLLVPAGIVAAFSMLVKPVFVDRYLIISLPALVLLAGAGLAGVRPRWLCVPLLLLFLYGSGRTVNGWYTTGKKDDWRGVTAAVLAQARPGDAALFYVYGGRHCFDYYRGKLDDGNPAPASLELSTETRVDGRLGLRVNEQLLSSLPARYERIWLIVSHDTALGDRPDKAQVLAGLQAHYVKLGEQEFAGVRVLLYGRPESAGPDQARCPGGSAHRRESNVCAVSRAAINGDGSGPLYRRCGSEPRAVGSSDPAVPWSGPGSTL